MLCASAFLCVTGLLSLGDDPKPKLEMSKEEKEFVELTNKERAKAELPPLEPNALLFKAARAHSANMAKNGELEHKLDGKDIGDRAEGVGYDWSAIGENIATNEEDSPAGVVKLWMGSE